MLTYRFRHRERNRRKINHRESNMKTSQNLVILDEIDETDERNVELNEFGIADTVDLACEMDLEMVPNKIFIFSIKYLWIFAIIIRFLLANYGHHYD